MKGERYYAFLAEFKRVPDPEEAEQIAALEREDRRQAEAARHEAALRRAYLAQPGSTPESWEKERATILSEDRKQRALRDTATASASQSTIYRAF